MKIAATVSEKLLLASCCGEDESATCTLNENVPVAVGVPEITPAVLKESPPGKDEPDESDHASGAMPPVVASVCVYAAPNFAGARPVVVIASGAAIRMVSDCVLVCCGVPLS